MVCACWGWVVGEEGGWYSGRKGMDGEGFWIKGAGREKRVNVAVKD